MRTGARGWVGQMARERVHEDSTALSCLGGCDSELWLGLHENFNLTNIKYISTNLQCSLDDSNLNHHKSPKSVIWLRVFHWSEPFAEIICHLGL